ncbi:hypothetical protein [Saccharomonospora iraqiensis]|uniref:hypothetical protein n=1 Tax=Saccharomonospora iraqiensis TaxID=52698 RepID=UPI00022DFCD3|nr:hypothetical protein [Saccharomonospora iraqiensis]
MTERENANEFDLPPHHTLPPHVRDRMLTGVREDLHRPQRRVKAPVGAAAAVAVLAGGAFVVTGTTGDGDPTVSPAAGGSAERDRCAAAVESAGRTADFPDRASWEVVSSAELDLTTVTEFRAGETRVFCETSETSVSLSAPVAAGGPPDGTGVRAAMTTPNGTVVGLAGDAVDGVHLAVPADDSTEDAAERGELRVRGTGPHINVVPVENGVFRTALAHHDLTDRTLSAHITPSGEDRNDSTVARKGQPLPPVPPELVVTDRPAQEPDRSSAEGRMLTECLTGPDDGRGGAVVDARTWRAGATLREQVETEIETGEGTTSLGHEIAFVMGVNDRAVGICSPEPSWHFTAHPSPDEATSPEKPVAPVQGSYEGGGIWVAGVLDEGIARVELSGGDTEVSAEARERTFAAFVPGVEFGDTTDTAEAGLSVRAYDADGAPVHEGPLPTLPEK